MYLCTLHHAFLKCILCHKKVILYVILGLQKSYTISRFVNFLSNDSKHVLLVGYTQRGLFKITLH